MISVLLLTTSGFSLIHHHCNNCGIEELSISIFDKEQNSNCDHKNTHHIETTCESTCALPDIINLETEPCCSSNAEFYKLDIPISIDQDNYVTLSPDVTDLLFFPFHFIFDIKYFIESQNSFFSPYPPGKLRNQSLNILNCINIC